MLYIESFPHELFVLLCSVKEIRRYLCIFIEFIINNKKLKAICFSCKSIRFSVLVSRMKMTEKRGIVSNLTNAFLVSPLTLVFLVEKFEQVRFFSNNDAQESWTYQYGNELAALLALLRNWKISQPGRELVILDGDVHMGGYTDITFDKDFALLQFTSSSIASSAPSDIEFAGFDLIKEVQNLVDPWSYEQHNWTNKFNYGIVLVNYANGQATSDCSRVEAKDDSDAKIVDDDGDRVDDSDWRDALTKNT